MTTNSYSLEIIKHIFIWTNQGFKLWTASHHSIVVAIADNNIALAMMFASVSECNFDVIVLKTT